MLDLKNLPSTSASRANPELTEPDFLRQLDAPPPARPAPPPGTREERAQEAVRVEEVMRHPPRSLRMQLRYVRVLVFFGWLFARLLFWHMFLARWAPEYVKRGNLARWTGYARSFRGFAIAMGGMMIKAGQFVSTRSDILPPEITRELASLRDEVPGVPVAKIRRIIEEDLGPIDQRFIRFDEAPLAAASLGQVHRARLKNGEKVVVKVLRPGIVDICYTDLAAMNVVAHIAMRFGFIARRANAVALIREFGRVLLEELSYEHEARNNGRFADMFRDDLGVYIPAVHREHSSDRVLTMEDVTTIKLDDFAALEAAGISRKAVAKRLMDTYLRQIFEERFFHADPHPGNLFVYPLPESVKKDPAYRRVDHGGGEPFYLIFIDFGMTASVTPEIVAGLIDTLGAVIARDPRKLIQSYADLGFLLPNADLDRLEAATRQVFDQVWGLSMEQLRNTSFDSMADIGKEFSDLLFAMPFQVPQDFIYLGRTVSILSGMATSLDPAFNPWSEMQPYTQKLLLARNGSDGAATALGLPVLGGLFSGGGAQTLVTLGQTVLGRSGSNATLGKLESGEITLKTEAAPLLRGQLARIEAQGRRTQRAVVFGSLLITATLFYANGDAAIAVIGWIASAAVFLTTLGGD
jgi:predicted unusual protein kinase regulating ubiquinone biosynthesis (AarF/ABC1/UbiB family)